MAKELAQYDIRLNSISPNGISTNLNQSVRENNPERWEKFLKKTPMKRAGTTNEVANAAVFLASDEASYITGVDVPVDGGLLCSYR